jgi:hypothetical protein
MGETKGTKAMNLGGVQTSVYAQRWHECMLQMQYRMTQKFAHMRDILTRVVAQSIRKKNAPTADAKKNKMHPSGNPHLQERSPSCALLQDELF